MTDLSPSPAPKSRTKPNWWDAPEKCEKCGRFVSIGAPGVSHSQSWSYALDGMPDLRDPVYRCSPCTDKHGIPSTNCANPDNYRGRNP